MLGTAWQKVIEDVRAEGENIVRTEVEYNITTALLAFFLACICGYGVLFFIGSLIFGNYPVALILFGVAAFSGLKLLQLWRTRC